jgi:hypothetical protein
MDLVDVFQESFSRSPDRYRCPEAFRIASPARIEGFNNSVTQTSGKSWLPRREWSTERVVGGEVCHEKGGSWR